MYGAPEPQASRTIMREGDERAADSRAIQNRSDGDGLHYHRVDGVAALRLQDIRERHQEGNELSVTLREERQLWPNEWQQRPAVVKELFLGNRCIKEVSLEARQQELEDRLKLGVSPGDVERPDGNAKVP